MKEREKYTNLRDGIQFIDGSAHLVSNEATAVRSKRLCIRLYDVADVLDVRLFHQSTELSIRDLQRLDIGQAQ